MAASALHGFLVVDKPGQLTSHDVVARVRRAAGRAVKVGHAGTLDPMATGVLAVALGEATKTVPFVMDGEKLYRFSLGGSRGTCEHSIADSAPSGTGNS